MRAYAAFIAVLLALSSAPAFAATITLGTTIERDGPGHDQMGFEFFISRSDCESSEVFTFPFDITDAGGVDSVQVWLSDSSEVDCRLIDSRSESTDGKKCVQLAEVDADEMGGTVQISSRDIANAIEGVADDGDGDCIDQFTGSASHHVTLYFLLITTPGESVPEEESVIFETEVDLVGPTPPTNVVAKNADEAVKLEFDGTDADDLRGYFVYCAPADGGSGTTSATTATTGAGGAGGGGAGGGTGGMGGAGDGGAGGGSTTAATTSATTSGTTSGTTTSATTGSGEGGGTGSSECASSALTPGAAPPTPEFRCAPEDGDDPLSATDAVTVTGLKNGQRIAMAVAAVDDLGNPGVLSEVVCGDPQEVDDFFGVYRDAGGTGGGGFCSAAPYGPGRRGAMALGALAFAAAAGFVVRRRRKRKGRGASLLLGLGLVLAIPSTARAQNRIPDSDWRQENRYPDEPADTQFAFEIRFAPYWPAVDSEPGLSGEPYKRTFGTDPNFYFGLEFDWMPLRIPYVGMFGPGIGWGYTWASANAAFTGCTPADKDADGVPDYISDSDVEDPCKSEDTTSLTIMPMYLSAVLRADELMRRTGVPIVPYAKFGPALGIWTAEQTAGVSTADGPNGEVKGEGLSWGLQVALGAAFALNWLDGQSAGRLRESTGVGHVYIFAEWMDLILTGFGTGDTMYVGTNTVVAGLSLDF